MLQRCVSKYTEMPQPGKLRYQCSAKNCQSAFYFPITNNNYKNKSFFRFPQDNPERRAKWCQIMDIKDLNKRMYLCENHFNMGSFTDTLKRKLTKFAIPMNPDTKINIISDICIIKPQSCKQNFADFPPNDSLSLPSTSFNKGEVFENPMVTKKKTCYQ